MTPSVSRDDIRAAAARIAPHIRRTPVWTLPHAFGHDGEVCLKLEFLQHAGSFKPRGAFNQILHLTPEQRAHGVVGVSGGNFAQALADAGRTLATPTMVCMPETAPKVSVQATRGYGATVELAATFPEVFARAEALRAAGACLLHPFDNPHQMAGVGTIGLECTKTCPR